MKLAFRNTHAKGDPIPGNLVCPTGFTKDQAEHANHAFDESVKQFLRHWIESGTVWATTRSAEADHDTADFVDLGALRSFFKHRDDAFELLLQQEPIASHLLRPISQVYFTDDAYEPLLSKFEQRIYNLAAHREHLEVPFRYSSLKRQGTHGDTVRPDDFIENIGMYFGTRRSNSNALTLLAAQLHRDASSASTIVLPVHVVTEGYMDDSLRVVKTMTEALQAQGDDQPHCFVIQRRHAADDRHLGAALLIMQSQQPDRPQRVIFCDTLNPFGTPPWWDKFKEKLDQAFPQPAGSLPVSDQLEDGGVKLQRLHDGVPVRHQDIDCAFYTFSVVRSFIQIAKSDPQLLLTGSIDAIVSRMTAGMPEYYEQSNQPKESEVVREVNVVRRWNTGREAIQHIIEEYARPLVLV